MTLKTKIAATLSAIVTLVQTVSAWPPELPSGPKTTITPIPNVPINELVNSSGMNGTIPNIGAIIHTSMWAYSPIGAIAYIIICSMPFVALWIAGADIVIVAFIGLPFIALTFLLIPQYATWIATAAIVLSIAIAVYTLYRRGY